MPIAALLSHFSFIGPSTSLFISAISCFSHGSSQIPFAVAFNSAFEVSFLVSNSVDFNPSFFSFLQKQGLSKSTFQIF